MRGTRSTALAVALAVTAAACGGGNGTDVAGGSATSSDSPDTTEAVDAPVEEEDEESAGGELFSPTEVDRPFDLSGGATSSSEGVTVVDGDPLDALDGGVRRAVEPWETDWSRRTVDPGELLAGLPGTDPRDRIPPIDTPKFEPLAVADWLDEREPGALVRFDDEVRFYPLSILTRHEIVNDRYGDVPVAVTFCPLCNTALSFDRRVDGEVLRFGVSGLLRKSDLVMWDDATTTLWQQITGEAIIGELAGTQLEIIPTSIVSYGDALESFPEALSLSRDTGFGTAYGANPYVGYSSSASPFLFDEDPDPRFPALSRVVGVSVGGTDRAYPFETLGVERVVNDEIDGEPIVVFWGGDTADALDSRNIADGEAIGTGIVFSREVDGQTLTFSSDGADGFVDAETSTTWTILGRGVDGPLAGRQLETVPHRNEFWFAWAGFFPDGEVWEP